MSRPATTSRSGWICWFRAHAKPGKYTGTYTVTSNQGKFTGQISLKVWNFALPTAPALKSSFLFFQAGTSGRAARTVAQ